MIDKNNSACGVCNLSLVPVGCGRPDCPANKPTYIQPSDHVPMAAYKPGTNTGHGHVWPRSDGYVANCGGVSSCRQCKSHHHKWLADMNAKPGEETFAVKTNIKVGTITVGSIFTAEELEEFAVKMSGEFVELEADTVVETIAEMLRQAECKRLNLPI